LLLNLGDFFAKGDWLLLVMDAAIFVLAAWLVVEAFTAFNRERRNPSAAAEES
jgi:carbon starvation protein